MTAINPQAVRGPVTAVPVVAGTGVRFREDVPNNRVVAEVDETVIYEATSEPSQITTNTTFNLTESVYNFERVKILYKNSAGAVGHGMRYIESPVVQSSDFEMASMGYSSGNTACFDMNSFMFYTADPSKVTVLSAGFRMNISPGQAPATQTNRGVRLYKIIGVNRIASA